MYLPVNELNNLHCTYVIPLMNTGSRQPQGEQQYSIIAMHILLTNVYTSKVLQIYT